MTQVQSAAAGVERARPASAGVVRRRRTLPNGRAVVGGLLVAAAAVGVFSAYTSAVAAPTTSYVIAARDLAPGDTVAADALARIPLELPDAQRARAYEDTGELAGATVVEPLLAGELVQEGSVVAGGSEPRLRSVSFTVESARAVDGGVRAAERVDVLATYGTGDQACTRVVAADVAVVAVDAADSSLVGDSAGLTVTVAARSAQEAVAVTHAANAGTVTLVRATGADAAQAESICTPAAEDGGS